MNRRGFLGRLLASTAGLLIAPEALLWQPSPLPDLPLVVPGSLLDLKTITAQIAAGLAGELPACESVKSWPGCESGVHWFGLDMQAPGEVGPGGLSAQYIDPVVRLLSNEAKFRRLRRFGTLEIPPGVERAAIAEGHGVSVRGLMVYDIYRAAHVLRFDILGAC
jgi:hypothetical protein